MSAGEKPLHVQVAEALGWEGLTVTPMGELRGSHDGLYLPVPHYDTDWAATGPLIEKLKMWVFPDQHAKEFYWEATIEPGPEAISAEGPTPLAAVCHLILALKAAGKL